MGHLVTRARYDDLAALCRYKLIYKVHIARYNSRYNELCKYWYKCSRTKVIGRVTQSYESRYAKYMLGYNPRIARYNKR